MQRAELANPVFLPKFFSLSHQVTLDLPPFPLPNGDLKAFYESPAAEQFVTGFDSLLSQLKSWLVSHAPNAPFNAVGYARLQRHLHFQEYAAAKTLLNFYHVAIPALWRIKELLANDLIPEAAKITKLVDLFNVATECEGGAGNEFSDIEIALRSFLSLQDALTKLRLDIAQQLAREIYANYEAQVEPLGESMQTHYVRAMLNANADWLGLPYQADPQACDESVTLLLAERLQQTLASRLTPQLIYDSLWFGTDTRIGLKNLLTEFYQAVLAVQTSAGLRHSYAYFLTRLTLEFGPAQQETFVLADLINITDEQLPDYRGETEAERLANVASWKAEQYLRIDLLARLNFAEVMRPQQESMSFLVASGNCVIERNDLYSSRVTFEKGASVQPLFTFCIESIFANPALLSIWVSLLNRINVPYKEELLALLLAYTRSPAYRDYSLQNGARQAWQRVVEIHEAFSQTFKEGHYLQINWPIQAAQTVVAKQLRDNDYPTIELVNGELFLRAMRTLTLPEITACLRKSLRARVVLATRLSFPAVNLLATHLRQHEPAEGKALSLLVHFVLHVELDFECALALLDGREKISARNMRRNLAALLDNASDFSASAWNRLIHLIRKGSSSVKHSLGHLSVAHLNILMQRLDESQQFHLQEIVIRTQGFFPVALLSVSVEDRAQWACQHIRSFIHFCLVLQANAVTKFHQLHAEWGSEWMLKFFVAFTEEDLAQLARKRIPKSMLLALVPAQARLALLKDWLQRCPEYFSPDEDWVALLSELNSEHRAQFVRLIDVTWLKPERFMDFIELMPPGERWPLVQHVGTGLPRMPPVQFIAFLMSLPAVHLWPMLKSNFQLTDTCVEAGELLKRLPAEDIADCLIALFEHKAQNLLIASLRYALLAKLSAEHMPLFLNKMLREFPNAFHSLFNTARDKVLFLEKLPMATYKTYITKRILHPWVGIYAKGRVFVAADKIINLLELLSGLRPEQYQRVLSILNLQQDTYCYEALVALPANHFPPVLEQGVNPFRSDCLAYLLNQQTPPRPNAEDFFALLKSIPALEQATFIAALKPACLTWIVLQGKTLREVLVQKEEACSLSKLLVYCQLYINDCKQDQRVYRNRLGVVGLFGEPTRETKLAAAVALFNSIVANRPGEIGNDPVLQQALSRDTLGLILSQLRTLMDVQKAPFSHFGGKGA